VLKKVINESGKTIEDWGVYGGWKNEIGNMKNTEGYKINVTSAATLNLNGISSQFPFEIDLKAGWNIISWPSMNEQDGMDVFQTLIDGNILKKVMDESGNVIEDYGVYGGWKNFVGNLKPGEGYKVNVTSASTLTINESGTKSSVIAFDKVDATYFKPVFKGNGVDHMNINLVNLAESGIKVGDELGIFDGNICVGATMVTDENSSILNLIASASDGDSDGFMQGNEIQLKHFRNGVEYPLVATPVNSASFQFEKNGTIFVKANTDLNTNVVQNENEFSVNFYPNPFHEALNIEVQLLQREELTVEVYDLLSRSVAQLYKGNAEGIVKLQWDGNDSEGNRMAPGFYICRVNGLLKKVVLN
jgi:hypothetical protein